MQSLIAAEERKNKFAARNFRILHPIFKDAEMVRFCILQLCQERSIVIFNYNVGCSAPPYCNMHFQAILYFLPKVHWVRKYIPWFLDPEFISIDVEETSAMLVAAVAKA
jgi:hypothetical protein